MATITVLKDIMSAPTLVLVQRTGLYAECSTSLAEMSNGVGTYQHEQAGGCKDSPPAVESFAGGYVCLRTTERNPRSVYL